MPAQAGAARIAGIGMDIVRLERVQRVFDRHPQRFVQRVLGPGEIQTFQRRYARDPRRGICYLATRFAAKEAFSKAIGLGMRMPMAWSRMQTLNGPGGRPYVQLSEPLAGWYAQRFGVAHVSVTDEHDIVAAYVVVEALAQPAGAPLNAPHS